MRVAIIGNSHLASLLTAHKQAPEAGADLAFWGVAGREFYASRVTEAGRLLCPHEDKVFAHGVGGDGKALALADFDVLVFHAEPVALPHFCVGLRWSHMDPVLVSQALLDELLQGWLDRRKPWQMLRRARAAFPGRILAVQQPMWRARSIRARRVGSIDPQGLERIQEHLARILSGEGAEYLPQPPETLGGRNYTRECFAKVHGRGRDMTLEEYRALDHAHMNSDYGRIVLGQIAAHLARPAGMSPA